MPKAKIIVLFVVIVLLLGGAGVYWWVYTQSEGYQAEKFVKDLERQYREDTVGGKTPEETLQLFIEALKRGDTELAARYFLLEDQDKWRDDLARIKERNLLKSMLSDLEALELSKKDEDEAFYVLTDETNLVVVQMVITRNPLNGIWKITEL